MFKKRFRSLDDITCLSTDENEESTDNWDTKVSKKKARGKSKVSKELRKCQLKSKIIPIKSNAKQTKQTDKEITKTLSDMCVGCNTSCDNTTSLRCDFCDDHYHINCTNLGLSPEQLSISPSLINSLGWMCNNCRSDVRKLLGNFRAGSTNVDQHDVETTDATNNRNLGNTPVNEASVGANKNSMTTLVKSDQINPDTLHGHGLQQAWAGTQTIQSLADVERIVRKTIKDASRRKSNIIISGLHESSACSDENLVRSLCRDHLGIYPQITSNGTKRLGKPDSNNSKRRLLVRLPSDQMARDLLISSRDLRKSDDSYIANNIFFNPDLTREEEKLAYEKRVRKRANTNVTADPNSNVQTSINSRETSSSAWPSRNHLPSADGPSSNSTTGKRVILNSNYNSKKATAGSNMSNLIVCNDENFPRIEIGASKTPNSTETTQTTSDQTTTGNSVPIDVSSTLNPNIVAFIPSSHVSVSVDNCVPCTSSGVA